MSINKATLLGHVCQDPKVVQYEKGKVAYMNLATNEKGYTTKEGHIVMDSVEYHRLVVSRPGLVELIEKYVKKGSKLYVEGKIKSHDIFDEHQNLIKEYEIKVDVVELC